MKLIRELRGPTFEKVAGQYRMGDNPATYPSELLAQLYKQHAYLGKYEVNLNVEGQDPTGSFMYGVFTVKAAQDVPPSPGIQRMGEVVRQPEPTSDAPELRVPIIVENKKAYSFDTFITPDGKFYPLNERRGAAMLFDANAFAVAPNPAPAMGGAGQASSFQPDLPGGSTRGMSPNASVSTKTASIFDGLAGTIDNDDVERLVKKIASSEELRDAFKLNEDFASSLRKISAAAEVEKVAQAEEAPRFGDFEAAVITKTPGGYSVKTASADGFSPETHPLSNKEAYELPVDVRERVFKTGSAVLVPDDHAELKPVQTTEKLAAISETGIYSVMTKAGSVTRAAVVTGVTTLDGRSTDLKIIVGQAGAGLQEKVAGVRCGDFDAGALTGSDPRGQGVFFFKTADTFSEPVNIKSALRVGDVEGFLYNDEWGRSGRLVKTAGISAPIKAAKSDYLIPEDAIFIPMDFNARYSGDTTHIEKVAARRDYMNKVSLISDGNTLHFRGAPVEGFEKSAGYGKDEAALVLGCLGDTASGASDKIASALSGNDVEFVATRSLIKDIEKSELPDNNYLRKIAEDIRVDLVKEAGALAGADTVDSVLSLNFITPENVQGYVDALPDLEGAVSRLAELLMGVRLGLSDVPENAVTSALRGTERAIHGLKKLQIRLNAETST